jgi:hypothetical protein
VTEGPGVVHLGDLSVRDGIVRVASSVALNATSIHLNDEPSLVVLGGTPDVIGTPQAFPFMLPR